MRGETGKVTGNTANSGGTERRPLYSELQWKVTIYGLERVYTDNVRVDEGS